MADKKGPSGFIVMLADGIMVIPQDSPLSWITLFYALPRELVEKRPAYLSLPRNIIRLLSDENARKLIEDDAFLELVWDSYAWSAWQFFQIPHKDGTYHDIPGEWSNYSGDFPLWRISWRGTSANHGMMTSSVYLYIAIVVGRCSPLSTASGSQMSLTKWERVILSFSFESFCCSNR